MKILTYFKTQTILSLSFQYKIINKSILLLFILFLIQTTQARIKLTGNFLSNTTLSSSSLELEKNNLYNKSEKES